MVEMMIFGRLFDRDRRAAPALPVDDAVWLTSVQRPAQSMRRYIKLVRKAEFLLDRASCSASASPMDGVRPY
jgi:hypothetical protein